MRSMCLELRCQLLFAFFLVSYSAIPTVSAQFRDGLIPLSRGEHPFHVGVNPATNRIYLSSEGNGFDDGVVNVLDGATNRIISTVSVGAVAEDIVANPKTNVIYVASFGEKNVAVIDGEDHTVVATIALTESPLSIGVNTRTNRVYVRGERTISVLDGLSNTLMTTIPVEGGPAGLVVDEISNRIFVNDVYERSVVVVSGATNSVIDTVPLGSGQPRGLAVNPATNRLYVTAERDVKVINTTTMSIVSTIPVNGYTFALALNTSTNRLYVRTEHDGVAVIDTLTNNIVKTFVVTDVATNADIDVNSVTNTIYVPIAQTNLVWVAEDPSSIGGRDLGINIASNGVRLSWTPGTKESGYSILRWQGNDGETLETIAGLAKGKSSYIDQVELTDTVFHYALLPLDSTGNPMHLSDIVGVWPSSPSSELVPSNFTLRHTGHAYQKDQLGSGVEMSWEALPGQAGYAIAANYADDSRVILVSEIDTRAIQAVDEPACFKLYAAVGEEIGHTHALCAVPLTWAMRNEPSLSRALKARAAPNKITKPISKQPIRSAKSVPPTKTSKAAKPGSRVTAKKNSPARS